jgi:hypothetical protein
MNGTRHRSHRGGLLDECIKGIEYFRATTPDEGEAPVGTTAAACAGCVAVHYQHAVGRTTSRAGIRPYPTFCHSCFGRPAIFQSHPRRWLDCVSPKRDS